MKIKQQKKTEELLDRMGTSRERGILNKYCVGVIIMPDHIDFDNFYIARYPGEYRMQGLVAGGYNQISAKCKKLINEYNLTANKPVGEKVLHSDVIAEDLIAAINLAEITDINLEFGLLDYQSHEKKQAVIYSKFIRTIPLMNYFPPFNRKSGYMLLNNDAYFHVGSIGGSSIGIRTARGLSSKSWEEKSEFTLSQVLRAYGRNLAKIYGKKFYEQARCLR